MRTEKAEQRGGNGYPLVTSPVYASLDCPCYFTGDGYTLKPTPRLYCSKVFAQLILEPLEAHCLRYELGLVHIGVYAQRLARRADGSIIQPPRVSNHAHGTAIDVKGFTYEPKEPAERAEYAGSYDDLKDVETLLDVGEMARAMDIIISGQGMRAEMVREGKGSGWYHMGLFPKP